MSQLQFLRWRPKWLIGIGLLLVSLPFAAIGAGSPEPLARVISSGASTLKNYLLVADTTAEELYVFSIPEMTLTGQLDSMRLAAHMGTTQLPDGRILLVDDKNVQFLRAVLECPSLWRQCLSVRYQSQFHYLSANCFCGATHQIAQWSSSRATDNRKGSPGRHHLTGWTMGIRESWRGWSYFGNSNLFTTRNHRDLYADSP